MIVSVFSRYSAEQVVERLDAAQIANARDNDKHDVWHHPQLQARNRWTDVETAVGRIPALLPPGQPDTYAPRMDAVPALGADTETILRELGIDGTEIAILRAAHVV